MKKTSICLLTALAFAASVYPATAQNTVFTYQGLVTDNGTNFTGTGQFQFALVTSTNTSSQALAIVSGVLTGILGSGPIDAIQVNYGGSGYITAPAVTITGSGSGATAVAMVSGGVVTNITITAGGTRYTRLGNTVTIAPPPPNYSNLTYWSNDGTSVNGGEPVASVGIGVANGLFTVVMGNTNLPNMLAIPVSLFSIPNLELQIWFNDGAHEFAALNPPQPLTPAPYAVFAANAENATLSTTSSFAMSVPAAGITGTLTVSQLTGTLPVSVITNGASGVTIAGAFTGAFTGNGAGLTDLNIPQIAGVVTNNETGVTLGSLTLSGNLNLPVPAVISSGRSPILYIDGNFNFFAGQSAGIWITSGQANTAVGMEAMSGDVNGDALTGNYNTANGFNALQAISTGSYNTADGANALGALGQEDASMTGSYNTASGYNALNANNAGGYNTAIGGQALLSNVSGNFNTAVGDDAMKFNVTGGTDVAVGYQALLGGRSLNYSTAVGYQALKNSVTDANGSGDFNLAIGYQALLSNTDGSVNTAVGTWTLQNLLAGSGNTALGYNAGNRLVNGADNIYIGNPGNATESGIIRIGTPGTQTLTYIAGTIENPTVNNITITGGSDLAEPFAITTAEQPVAGGEVVVIDEANPGQLKLTHQPYDTRVAGVISGANGIHPGIQMHQEGMLGGGKNVALSGRVYVQADTSNGAINPGDLLTTSSTPGRAMRVSDHARAQGAILGKAMTSLKNGQGMVLVLVTLQ